MVIKKMDYAGSWYPATPQECEQKIQDFTRKLLIRIPEGKDFSACISPHAGWSFSGSIACNMIKLLKGDKQTDVIVLFGKHLHRYSPATILTGCKLETPFGNIEIDEGFSAELLRRLDLKKDSASTHGADNTIELQLPFIKYFFPDAKIIVIGAPLNELSMEIGRTVSQLAQRNGAAVKIVGSTDMTHYGDTFGYTPAGYGPEAFEWVKSQNDKKMLEAMTTMNTGLVLQQALENQNACCGGAVAATVAAVKELGVTNGEIVAYSNSYDLSPSESFVGYGGVVY